jgi:hypothetical protein
MQEMIELEAKKKRDKEEWVKLKTIKERTVAIKEERLRIKDSEDNKIMFVDKTTLELTQKAYVATKRAQILASVMNFTMGCDLNSRWK